MSKSTYSFGEESPLKFEISDKLAKHYNEAVDIFLKAHRRFTQKHGRKWNPIKDPVIVRWNPKQQKAWNVVAEIFNELTGGYDHEAGPFHPNDFMEDFLVKNIAETVSKPRDRWTHVLTLSTLGGALYVLLRGLKTPF